MEVMMMICALDFLVMLVGLLIAVAFTIGALYSSKPNWLLVRRVWIVLFIVSIPAIFMSIMAIIYGVW